MTRWSELIGALTLLTRLPVGNWTRTHPPPADCVWAYPVVGALVGSIGAAILWACMALGLPQPLAAVWALAATILVTGALHEDGLADTADGFGGGRTRDRKLAIMRDSRIGTYGTLALILSLALRAIPLANTSRPTTLFILAGVFGRGAILIQLALLRPARADGLANTLAAATRTALTAGLAVTAAAAWLAPASFLAALTAALAATAFSHRQLNGYTGDTLGTAVLVTETVIMAALAG